MKLLFAFLLLIPATVYSQPGIVKINDVVKEFYTVYDAEKLEYPTVNFEKRKDGWYVETQKIENNKLVRDNRWLFFDNASKKFLELEILHNEKPGPVKTEEYVSAYDIKNFDLQPCYGYAGWYRDVIDLLKDEKNISDNNLYALGRAYSAYAGSRVSGYSGYTDTADAWKLPFSINCMSSKQVDAFTALGKKATDCFKKLADRNPKYETVVGDIRMKYANEVMFLYQVLLAYSDTSAAKMKIPEGLYSETQLAEAKKWMNDCPQGAVLISFGDNDYYPVHYLQKVKKYRTDIMLVNFHLLGIDRYIHRATFKQYAAAPVPISLGPELYKENLFDVIYIKQKKSIFPLASLSEFLKENLPGSEKSPVLETDAIRFSSSAKSGQGEIDLSDDSRLVDLKDVKYLLKNEWLLLEILENRAQRKICFPDLLSGNLSVLNDWLEPVGSVWVFKN